MKIKQKNNKGVMNILLLPLLFLFAIAAASCGGGGDSGGGDNNSGGGGGTPNIAVSPASLNFGTVNVGASSSSQAATINNTGAAALSITSISITGTDAGQFSQTNNCPASLAAGNSCDVQAIFSPTSGGAKGANLTIASNDPDTPTVNVALSGTGVTGNISVSTTSLDFGSVTVGSVSSPLGVVIITNNGTADLVITAISLAGNNAAEFSISSGSNPLCNASGQTLSPSGWCQIQSAFAPTSAGTKNASIVINSNDADTPTVNVTMTGNGVTTPVSNISVQPISIGFGSYYEGTSSPPYTMTISNTGTANLNIGAIALSGADATQFSKQNDNCSGQAIATSTTCTLQVVFSPTSPGGKSASLAIPSNDPDMPTVNVALSGTGVAAPNISAICYQDDGTGNLVQVSCNPIPMTTCIPSDGATITVSNNGSADLNVASLNITGTGASYFSIASDACTGTPVTAGNTCDVTVGFAAAIAGTRIATLAIASNDPDTPTLNVGLRGIYVNPNLCP